MAYFVSFSYELEVSLFVVSSPYTYSIPYMVGRLSPVYITTVLDPCDNIGSQYVVYNPVLEPDEPIIFYTPETRSKSESPCFLRIFN